MPQRSVYFDKKLDDYINDFSGVNNLSFAGAVKALIRTARHSISRRDYEDALRAIDMYRERLRKYESASKELKDLIE